MLNRAFFSLQSNWIPSWVALGNLGLNAALDAAFYRLGIWGIPLATSIVNIAGSAALFVLLRRRLGRLELRRDGRTLGRVTAASAVLAVVAYGVWWLARPSARRLVSRGARRTRRSRSPPGSCAYAVSCRLLGVRELEALLSLRGRAQRG